MGCINVSGMAGERKMKICQLCAVDFTMRKFLLPLIDGQVASGDTVTGVCSDGEYVQGMLDEGYRIHTIPISRSMHPIKHVCSIWKLYRYFRREQFDVVHVHTPVAALVGRILTKHVSCLAFLEDVAVKHIGHQYSKEAANPTKTVSNHFNFNPLFCCWIQF